MSRPRRALRLWALLAALALAGVFVVGGTVAAFSDSTDNAANQVSAAPDFVAPAIGSAVVAKTPGYDPSFIKQDGSYYVYANVAADTGNPASGISTVRADVSSIDSGETSVPLVAGAYSVGGASYNHRSAALGADNPLAAGNRAFTITATDNAANASTFNGTVTVDNTAPTSSDVQTANGGAIAGRPEANDTVTFTFSEPIDPESILAGWDGTTTDVVVRIDNGFLLAPDTLLIYNPANTAQLPLGTVDLGSGGYVGTDRTYGAGAVTKSKMTRSGNSITIVLGTASGAGTTPLLNGNNMSWTPSTSTYDRAGNNGTGAPATELGAGDQEF